MDVIGPHQAGFTNVVATMGTSLTETHARLLKRYATRVVLAMDPDGAGAAAAERAGSIVLGISSSGDAAESARAADAIAGSAQIDLRVAVLPGSMDPDDLARERPDLWKSTIAGSMPFPEFLIERLLGGQRPDSGLEARRLVDQVRPVLVSVRDPVERAMYVQRLARRLGVNEQAVSDRIRPGPRVQPRPQQGERRVARQEDYLLSIVLAYPSLRYSVRNLPPDLFADTLNREIFARWTASELDELEVSDDALGVQLARLKAIRLPVFSGESARKAAREKIDAILRERLSQRQGALVAELAAAEEAEGTNRMAEVGASAWLGNHLSPADEQLAHLVIEELELGLSLHRHEAPELA
jgi:DNA primase